MLPKMVLLEILLEMNGLIIPNVDPNGASRLNYLLQLLMVLTIHMWVQ